MKFLKGWLTLLTVYKGISEVLPKTWNLNLHHRLLNEAAHFI